MLLTLELAPGGAHVQGGTLSLLSSQRSGAEAQDCIFLLNLNIFTMLCEYLQIS